MRFLTSRICFTRALRLFRIDAPHVLLSAVGQPQRSVTDAHGIAAFAASFPYSTRPCYAGIGEFSVYVARDQRRQGAGRVVLSALIEAAHTSRLHKLTSRVFPENAASRALLKRLGFSEVGTHQRHGKLDGIWRDCVIVELLLDEEPLSAQAE